MIIGTSVSAFTTLHVIISLVALAAGFVVMYGMVAGRRLPGWTAAFLATIVLTSVTGFMFPLTVIGPPHIFGAVSLVVLAFALYALYARRLAGHWRIVYVGGALLAHYLNAVVTVVQAFGKIGVLHQLAPTQTEAPFLLAQTLVLVLFVAAGALALRRFHPEPQVLLQTGA
jgi:hypothetical protein